LKHANICKTAAAVYGRIFQTITQSQITNLLLINIKLMFVFPASPFCKIISVPEGVAAIDMYSLILKVETT